MTEEIGDRLTESLFLRAAQGDQEALGDLVEAHLGDLRAFVRLHMDAAFRARESSSDLVQSTCRELLARPGDFEYRGHRQFRAWLFTAALNKIREKQRFHLRHRRDLRREVGSPTTAGVDAALLHSYAGFASPSQAAIAGERAEQIEAAFDRLPDEYRDVLTLSRIAGLPTAEIAERVGKSQGAVRMLLARALNRLSVELSRAETGGA